MSKRTSMLLQYRGNVLCTTSGLPLSLPHALTDETIRARSFLHSLHERLRLRETCDLSHELRPDCLGELMPLPHRDDERPCPTNHAIPVVEVQILDLAATAGTLEHERQAVDDDALGHRLVASQR